VQQHTTEWRQTYINLNDAAETDHLDLVQLQAGAFSAVDFSALLGVATFGRMNLLHISPESLAPRSPEIRSSVCFVCRQSV